jgi:hypothetical protein
MVNWALLSRRLDAIAKGLSEALSQIAIYVAPVEPLYDQFVAFLLDDLGTTSACSLLGLVIRRDTRRSSIERKKAAMERTLDDSPGPLRQRVAHFNARSSASKRGDIALIAIITFGDALFHLSHMTRGRPKRTPTERSRIVSASNAACDERKKGTI